MLKSYLELKMTFTTSSLLILYKINATMVHRKGTLLEETKLHRDYEKAYKIHEHPAGLQICIFTCIDYGEKL